MTTTRLHRRPNRPAIVASYNDFMKKGVKLYEAIDKQGQTWSFSNLSTWWRSIDLSEALRTVRNLHAMASPWRQEHVESGNSDRWSL
jgi:hypothetical protein